MGFENILGSLAGVIGSIIGGLFKQSQQSRVQALQNKLNQKIRKLEELKQRAEDLKYEIASYGDEIREYEFTEFINNYGFIVGIGGGLLLGLLFMKKR